MRAHLTTHAILDTIPLRIGVVLSERRVLLENSVYDQTGTDLQNRREISDKRYHVIANLVVTDRCRTDLGRWRFVVKDSDDPQRLPPVFTVLPIDSDIRTEANLTKAISDARQSGDPRITPAYVCNVLNPLYRSGSLKNQQDLSDQLNRNKVESLVSALEDANDAREALLERIAEFEAKEAVLDQEMSKVKFENELIKVTDCVRLIDAQIVTVQRQNGPTQYTQITLDNGSKLLKKWDIPGTLAKARSLKGKVVRTTVWNRPPNYDYWKSTEWFEDIYEVNTDRSGDLG